MKKRLARHEIGLAAVGILAVVIALCLLAYIGFHFGRALRAR